ncbi:putative Nodulation protein L [Magnetospirillum gryphiswaldense MSR-1 v2]|uniref:Nodulation protein L n=1 Tax=Magnetospirillum gryphiswaldense (strain DSM 6361 / JCM 21280 / NBRC 15271 / MSR-1) TaxID=431944 RepID=V6F8B1_MAGGM|nr:acyltransferase [Magnetospirillum gryphiswaldense]CDL00661.1 putative Nodulation protein L [Magnetospirillum gryphiswaldense MSR-1 v2]
MDLLSTLQVLYRRLTAEMRSKYDRRVPLGDLLTDRWEIARSYAFGAGSSCYDSVLILGDVRVGENTWIGPNCILDGSGGPLIIGDWCSISAGVHIYTHDTVRRSTSLGVDPIDKAPVSIGSGVYIGPNSVVAKGVTIGDKAVIGAMSLVNRDIPGGTRAWGTPARAQP